MHCASHLAGACMDFRNMRGSRTAWLTALLFDFAIENMYQYLWKYWNMKLCDVKISHTHTRLTALFPGLPGWASTRKVKTNLDFTKARDSEWQWHQLGHMQVCISLQSDNHASTPPLKFFTGQMPFLPTIQQCQSTEISLTYNLCGRVVHRWFTICIKRSTRSDVRCSSSLTCETDSSLKPVVPEPNS